MSANENDVRIMIDEETSPLAKHAARFSAFSFFSPATVIAGLKKIHASLPEIKGPIIATFHSAHAGNICPFLSSSFKPDEQTAYAKYLHLGTTRVWKSDGTIDELRWQKLVHYVTLGQGNNKPKIVIKSALKNYLQRCNEIDPQESNTGRNTHSWFSSATVQTTAAAQAWDVVFERLACGWSYNDEIDDYEPYIDLDLVRLFFEDSSQAFLRAENQGLPVPVPEYYPEQLMRK